MTRRPGQAPTAVPLVLVQHAHQHIVADGYDNREGVLDLHRALSGLLLAHLSRRVPLALHVSGTLTEAMAWHVPEFAAVVRRLLEEGLLELVGSAYAQNVLPLFSPQHNRRQLVETLCLYERHYGVSPEQVRCLWVPERVWDTQTLADVVTDPSLPNGGYRTVLLDDRHAYPVADIGSRMGAGAGGDVGAGRSWITRAQFDAASAPAVAGRGEDPCVGRTAVAGDGRQLGAYRLADADDLVVLSLSSELRYTLPIQRVEQRQHLGHLLQAAKAGGPEALLVYGDDAERCAGVGAWGPRPWTEAHLAPYLATLDLLCESPDVAPVLPSTWLAGRTVPVTRRVDAGGFYELATAWGAGEDYRGYWDAPQWAPYRGVLESVERLLVGRRADGHGLWECAWKQLMVSAYETGWQEPDERGVRGPAPWARAVAAHARDARLLVGAALSAATATPGGAFADLGDLDGDGEDEVVLGSDAAYLVVSPRYGGRVVLACDLAVPGGRVVVGNPSDDWNWQEESHRFMQRPRNHPGALADVGHENDRHRVVKLSVTPGAALLVLENAEEGSPLAGVRKTLCLRASSRELEVCYSLPPHVPGLGVELAFSPDYLLLLRAGRGAVRALPPAPGRRGFAAGATASWVSVDQDQPVLWDRPVQPQCGHAEVVRLTAYGSFQLRLGFGLPVEAAAQEALEATAEAAVAQDIPPMPIELEPVAAWHP